MQKYLQELNQAQLDAVLEIDGPILIIAGAGSGKTKVLTYRIANLIHNNISNNSILALTFTNKAAEEMKSRIKKVLGINTLNIWAGTFHSIFARILRTEAELIGYTKNFTIYDTEDSLNAVKKVMNQLNISTQQYDPKIIFSKISGAKNNLITEKEYSAISKFGSDFVASKVYTEYQKFLKISNAMDFDDLLLNLIKLFETKKETLLKYQERFKYILVDEYQDTNKAQYKAVNLLAKKYQNICVVGDDAQSIYSFRGADISNILDFEKDYKNVKTFKLEQNYRSSKNILSIADSIIKNNSRKLIKNLWTENSEGEKIILHSNPNEGDEAKFVVNQILNLIKTNNVKLNEVAILYRKNMQSRVIEDLLRRNSIAYKIVGGVEFYQRKEIKDILAYLKLIVNQNDNVSFLRVVNYPTRGIGNSTLEKLNTIAQKQIWGEASYFEVIQNDENLASFNDKPKNSLINFKNKILSYKELLKKFSFNEVVRILVDEIGIVKELKEENSIESISRIENIYELLSAINDFCENKPNSKLEDFLQEVSLLSSIDKYDENQKAVTLMTIHASKGLEFENIFIVGIEDGILPSSLSFMSLQEIEEERRLFYVGITRAKSRLFLSYSNSRMQYGSQVYSIPSRFLDEIDKSNLIETSDKIENDFGKINFAKKNFKKEIHFNYEDDSQEIKEIKIGTLVEHEIFGNGKVTLVVGKGENKKAVVWFDEYGQKNLMLKFAPLRIKN